MERLMFIDSRLRKEFLDLFWYLLIRKKANKHNGASKRLAELAAYELSTDLDNCPTLVIVDLAMYTALLAQS